MAEDTPVVQDRWHNISVSVQSDHLIRLARRASPVQAVAELIWNSLDADADSVKVGLTEGLLGNLEAIEVRDNGTGMKFQTAREYFGRLGGSWKRPGKTTSENHRPLHGKLGRGRFLAFGAGNVVEWSTRFEDTNRQTQEFRILADIDAPGRFQVSEPKLLNDNGASTGTTVRVTEMESSALLDDQKSIEALLLEFAPYLKSYPDVAIYYNGEKLDPQAIQLVAKRYEITDIELSDGRQATGELEIVEWGRSVDRGIFFCDSRGVARGKIPARIHAPGFNFTGYFRSSEVERLEEDAAILMDELHPDVSALADAVRDTMRAHFAERKLELTREKIAEWKESGLYPYKEEPATVVERAERQVFDVIALEVSAGVSDFDSSSNRSQSLSLRLLREAVATGPRAVHKILEEVLDLSAERKNELARLLDHTSLEAIIEASRTVANRLDFLHGLEILLFDTEIKKKTLERRQLHEILVDHTWLFGEQFALTASDQSLNTVLQRHVDMTNVDLLPADRKTVTRNVDHNYRQRVDLMLARSIPEANPDSREYLIVEIKRPAKTFDLNDLNQVKKYAYAVEADDAYRDTDTRWRWWGVANNFDDAVRRETRQRGRPIGLAYAQDNTEIWIQTWGQVIRGAQGRLSFFQERLEYDATHSSAIDYLQQVHDQYLPGPLRGQARDSGPTEPR